MAWEGDAPKEEKQSELAPIPEEGAVNFSGLGDAAACMLFLLGLEVANTSLVGALPIGAIGMRIMQPWHCAKSGISSPWQDTSSTQDTGPDDYCGYVAALLLRIMWDQVPRRAAAGDDCSL